MTEHDVLGHSKNGDQHEVLMNHSDTGRHCVARSGELLDNIVQKNLALICLIEAEEHIHEGRLTRTIFTNKGVNLAGHGNKADVVVRSQLAKTLSDIAQFELHGSHNFVKE